MTQDSMTRRLEALESRETIRNVLYRYCQAVDRGDLELMKSCYHEDSTDDHSFFSGNGFEFAEYVLPQLEMLEVSVHSLTNPMIDLMGDCANVQTQWSVIHRIKGVNGLTDLWHQGRYLDIFERRTGEWKIAKRVAVLDCERWMKTADLQRLVPLDGYNSLIVGKRGKTDPSYNLETLMTEHRKINGSRDIWKPLRFALKFPVTLLHWLSAFSNKR